MDGHCAKTAASAGRNCSGSVRRRPRPLPAVIALAPYDPRVEALGPYRLLSQLGRGGMGTVWLAETAAPAAGLPAGARVAVKVVHPHLLHEPGFLERFRREADVGRRVRHGNVVRTHAAESVETAEGTRHLLVMEAVEGQTLRAMLDELGTLPETLCRHVGRETARGLAAIHEAGVVHRDVKPENLIVTPEHVVKVMDLGVSRLAEENVRLSRTGVFVGSILYAAPEQLLDGASALDGRADVYALGLTLYELSTGRHPFAADDPRVALRRCVQDDARPAGEVNPALSPFFEEVLACCLAKQPSDRFESADALAKVLDAGEESPWWAERSARRRVHARTAPRRPRIPRETGLFGRDAELARLGEAFERAKAGDGQVVLVEGEAGIGKTRLIDEWVGRLAARGEDVRFLFGAHPPGGAATSTGALAEAFREHLASGGVADGARRLLRAAPSLAPAFAALLAGEAVPAGAAALPAEAVPTAFVHAARASATEAPTVLLVDDLHFAPDEGRALFLALARAVPGWRLVLVGTARPGLPDAFTAAVDALPHARRFPLARLGPKDLAALLSDAFRSARLAEELGMRIGAKSDGNPLFVFEILRGLREERLITRREDGVFVRTQAIREVTIPSTVLDLVRSRLSGLEEEDRDVLEVAACCGVEFDPLLVGEALGLPRIPLLKRFAKLERERRVVRALGVRIVFDHAQVREAVYGGLSELLRREYHAAIGDAIEARERAAGRLPAGADGETALEISRHFLAGQRGESALPYLDAALDHLAATNQDGLLADLAGTALAAPGLLSGARRVETLLRRADALGTLGRRAEEYDALTEAAGAADALGEAALGSRVRRALGWHLFNVAKYAEARATVERALVQALEAGDPKLEGAAVGTLGNVLRVLREPDAAIAAHERQTAIGRQLGDRKMEATGLGGVGNVLWSVGRHEEALALHQRHLALAKDLGPREEATASGNLGLVLLDLGRFAEAVPGLERQLAVTREVGYRRGEAIAVGNLAEVYRSLGRLGEAAALLERHLSLAREIGYRRGEAIAQHNLGQVLAALGDVPAARRHLVEARDVAEEIGYAALGGGATASLAALDAEAGDLDAALAGFAAATARLKAAGAVDEEIDARLAQARALLHGGRVVDAREAATQALDRARTARNPRREAFALTHLAALGDADPAAAERALYGVEERLPFADRLEARLLLARAALGSEHADVARRMAEHLVAHAPPSHRAVLATESRLVREALAAR